MRYLILCCLFFASCRPSGTVRIEDAGKDTFISFRTNASYPTNLRLQVKGQVNDSFQLNIFTIPGGNVDTILNADWYDKGVRINYKAHKATQGKLIIKYNF